MPFSAHHIRGILGLFLITIIVLFAHVAPSQAEVSKEHEKPVKVVAVLHCDYPPVSFWDSTTNVPSGFFVDVMDNIARRAGLQVSYVCRNGWPEMMAAIESGEANLGALMKSEEREKKLLFSQPIEVSYLSFFARAQSSVDFDRMPAGYTVGVIRGSMSYEQLKKQPRLNLHIEGSYKEGIFSLLAGEIDLFAGEESMILKQARETSLEDRIKKVGKPFVERERGIAVRKDNAQLLALLNKVLPDLIGSPEYEQIYIKWYGRPTPYWTARKILIASGIFLLIIVCGMAAWRYVSISRINRELVRNVTERKRAEETLQSTNQTLSALIRYSPLAIICTDMKTNVLIWNPAAEQIFGWREEEVIGRKNPIVPEDKQDEYRRLREEVGQGNPYSTKELQRRRKDGRSIYINASSSALYDANGNVIALLGIFEDITERGRAEEEKERLSRAVSVVSEGIAITDEKDRFIYQNAAHARIYGYAQHELLGRTWRDLTPRGLVPQIEPELDKTLHTRDIGIWSGEAPALCKDGTEIATEITATARWNENGDYLGHVCVVRNISDRKLAEEKIRQSEEFIRSILDTVDEGFIVIDRDYRILTANRAYCNQVSLPCDDVIGKLCFEISHKANRPCYEEGEECAVRHVFETGEPHTALHKHPSGGHVLYVETKAYPIKDVSGRVTSVIEIINNITEKHLLEEERLKTQKLESIGTLAGGIAHDFNNLLQGVFGYISMAKMTFDQREKSLAMLDQAEKALHQSVNLTTQLLTFSKGGKPVKKRISMLPVIENAVKFALSGSRTTCQIRSDPDLWHADADEGQIVQVIQNIVLNADQAMPEGGEIEVLARNVEVPGKDLPHDLHEGKYVEIAVKDSGVGIPGQYLSKIFDPYFSTKERGSGLGLTTSYSIIRNHGGSIDVRSEAGKGSVFSFYLPATEVRGEEPTALSVPVLARKGRVLVMDDEDLVRNIVGEMIRVLGHEVELAEDGDIAIERYSSAQKSGRPFDLVILDLTVRGGMGGAETLRKLLAIDSGVKAVVSSGYSDDTSISDFQQQGFKAFLKKPYDVDELQGVLGALLTS